jgi:periplasmic protein TonB
MIFTRVVSDELSERAGAKAPRHAWHRARSLPALGMPMPGRRRRLATVVSVGLHILMVWLLLRPEALRNLNPDLEIIEQGGGGPGPAGGGGGGTRGTGGVKYIQVAPPPEPVAAPQVAPILPPIQQVVEPPKPVLPEPVVPQMELPKLATTDPKAEIKVESPIIGIGGGTGNDGTKGNGPGTGGGVGTGVGTGRGSGVGPGTGGGNLNYYPCSIIEMPIFPTPIPAKIRGFKVIANFDVDERGKLVKFEFTPSKDGGYNRKLNDLFKTFRFRAGSTLEGVPKRTTCQIAYEF